MGHLPIVNSETLNEVIQEGYISVRGDLKSLIFKTLADIMSDILATRKGDLVFPWIIRGPESKNIGFQYYFKIAGDPVYVLGDKYPIKVPMGDYVYKYQNPLREHEALDLWSCKLLWNAIGKKSLGRGRSLTHQMPMEDERMIEMLEGVNDNGPEKFKISRKCIKNATRLGIDLKRKRNDENFEHKIKSLKPEERISNLEFSSISWRKGYFFWYEKGLEAWLMQNIGREDCLELEKLVLFPGRKIRWFGNYSPFGVAGGNIDLIIIQEDEKRIKKNYVTTIELKVGALNKGNFDAAAEQVSDYSNFISRAFRSYGYEAETKKVILSGISGERYGNKEVSHILYLIDENGIVNFY